ncbi:MAG: class II aldolase/adducin family protein [Phycisphaerae bacterium]|jgi:rhamnose utilization protein RhaD (predicted bifunctional aldolase and dehydrogenase)
MDKTLANLIRISNITGKDPALIQGGGGNTSVKTPNGKFLFIKASGTGLKSMNARAGWCKLRLAPVLAIMKDKSIAKLGTQPREAKIVKRLLLACTEKASPASRPSVEAHLHAMLDNRCVIHLHPVAVLSFTCAKTGKAELKKLFENFEFRISNFEFTLPPLWIPYAHPGFALASQIAKLLADYQNRFGRKPSILFLQKHGLIVSADNPDAALKLLRIIINRCKAKLKYPKAVKSKRPDRKVVAEIKQCISETLFNVTGKRTVIKYFYDGQIAAFCRNKNAKKLLTPPALTPDELLYVNGPAVWFQDCDPKKITRRLKSLIKKGKTPPVAFLVKSVGLFVTAPDKIAPAVRDIVKNSLLIRTNASRLGGICALNKAEQNFINRWEADAFRKKLAEGR